MILKFHKIISLAALTCLMTASCRNDEPVPIPQPETYVRGYFNYWYNAETDSTEVFTSFSQYQVSNNQYYSDWTPSSSEITFNGAPGIQYQNLFYYADSGADSVSVVCNSASEGVYDYSFPSTDTIIYRLPSGFPNLSMTIQNWFTWNVPQVTSDPFNDPYDEMIYIVIKQDSIVEYVQLAMNAGQVGWQLDAGTEVVAGPALVQVRYEKHWEDPAQAAGHPLHCMYLFRSEYIPVTVVP